MKSRIWYIYISSFLSLAVLVTLSILFFNRFDTLKRYTGFVVENSQFRVDLAEIKLQLARAEAAAHGFIITMDSSLLDQFNAHEQNILVMLDSLSLRVGEDLYQKEPMRELTSTAKRSLTILSRNMGRMQRHDSLGLAKSTTSARLVIDQFNRQAEEISAARKKEGDHFFSVKERYQQLTPNYVQYVLWFACLFTIISVYYLQREVRMRIRSQQELQNRLRELNRSSAEIEQFSFVATHDLQEPLRKIRTFTDRLMINGNSEISEETRSVLLKLNQSALRLQEMIQDMVNFSNLVHKKERLQYLDLNEVVKKVLEEFADADKKAQLSVDHLPVILGYPEQIQLLFRSLLDNALKFSKVREQPEIRIRYRKSVNRQRQDFHEIIIQDNGIGFSNDFSKKIFVIFQRLHNQRSDYRGKGIGLAMAKRVMVNHNGEIFANGIDGRGSSFTLRFPA